MALATAPVPIVRNSCRTKAVYNSVNFEWTIDAIKLRPLDGCDQLDSPIFSAAEVDFKSFLRLFLGGQTDTKDYLSLYLYCKSGKTGNVHFSFSVLDANRQERFKKSPLYASKFQKGQDFSIVGGYSMYVLCKDLLAAKNLIVDDRLTIYCEVTILTTTINIMGHIPVKKNSMLQLSEDFGTLVNHDDFGDVTLMVGGKQFRAYKGILAVRSSVFAAMFRHDMQENQQNKVTIDGIDQEVFSELLFFIYTNRVPKLNEMAYELLEAADRYALKDLKTLCETNLVLNLTVDTAAKSLILADLHGAIKLKAKAIAFINKNVIDVIETENWRNLKENYPHLMEEAYVESLTTTATTEYEY